MDSVHHNSHDPKPTPDPDEIRRTIKLLFQAGDVVELRIPKAGRDGTISGYFDNPERLAAALEIDGKASGVYVTLNPVDPALLARSKNRPKTRAEAGEARFGCVARAIW